MTDMGRFREQVRTRTPDWRSQRIRKFRWSKLRREYGHWCFIAAPHKNVSDFCWFEWENGNGTSK